MKCPKCECGESTGVLDVRHAPDNEDYRQRKCKACNHIFYTVEFEVEPTESFMKEFSKLHRHQKKEK